MIFRQLFEPVSSTYTYVLGCEDTRQAVLIDPVISATDRDLAELARLDLQLAFTLDTHIHADHITAALELKKQTSCRMAGPAIDKLPCTDVGIEEGVPFIVGSLQFTPLHTPGHTDGHFAYLLGDRLLAVMPCSSTAAAGRIFRMAAPTISFTASETSSSPCQTTLWYTPAMITAVVASRPSRRKSSATPVSVKR